MLYSVGVQLDRLKATKPGIPPKTDLQVGDCFPP